ncbi:hypothetical protein Pint_00881 [Pistacia integerrima]|uniref:Uncharacterized protein n=1 Tax=Pistacia integerrima TaxID=434235 RepID=A0ACC0ZI64_9ROSI|nr:hypothetical protein Pint_00881 [Pistacia integerrima]
MKELGLLSNVNISNIDKCDVCVESKSTKKTCKPVLERENELLGLIHSDLGDSKQTITRGGKKLYITFIDDYSRYTRVYLLRSKDEVIKMFLTYKNEVENQLNKKIKRLRMDRGGEYESYDLDSFCRDHSIIHETTRPYSPQSNGVGERKNRILKEMVNAMLISFGALFNLLGEAMLSACYIQNIILFKKTSKTPYEL